MIAGWHITGKKNEEGDLGDIAFYHCYITERHTEKQCLKVVECRWEESAE